MDRRAPPAEDGKLVRFRFPSWTELGTGSPKVGDTLRRNGETWSIGSVHEGEVDDEVEVTLHLMTEHEERPGDESAE